jgi:ADP-ribosyl-[dinitrogen reductase] hydrolase
MEMVENHPVLTGLAMADQHGGPAAMANVLAESLAECGGLHIDDLTERYLIWWKRKGFDTGPIFHDVMTLLDQGISYKKAAALVDKDHQGMTAGCNPAHRIAPLSLVSSISIEELPELAMQEARITHHHPLAGDVSAAVAVLLRALLDGTGYEQAKEFAAIDRLRETREALLDPDGRPPHTSGHSPEALRAAIHFINHNPRPVDAVSEAIIFAGNPNFCPVLVGAITGAML